MNSKKGAANPAIFDPSLKGKSTSDVSGHGVDQLSYAISDMNVNSPQNEGWEEYTKKSKGKNKNNASQQSNTRAWGNSDTMQSYGGMGRGSGQTRPTQPHDPRKNTGRGFTKPHLSYQTPAPYYGVRPVAIPPPLPNGWLWSNRNASGQSSNDSVNSHASNQTPVSEKVDDDAEESEDDINDSDSDDDFDSDESQKSHDTKKMNKWFKDFFVSLDKLTVEQISEPERQWHCPACKGGPGAIDWYRGLQPLISHGKTKGSTRVKLHRELASLLEEELKRRGASAVVAGEVFGKWKGLEEEPDKEILWPPMVVIMNTRLEKDDNDKWIGMGNQELLDYFNSYAALKARHSYGPQGHRGMSVLIFEASAVGYAEAERLSKHFEDNFRDRVAWSRTKIPFYAGGKRQLYGYMAEKHDLDNFNQHCQGKTKQRYEMRSYKEMVVSQMKQMSEDNQQIHWLKHKITKEQRSKKALEESLGLVAEKLRRTMDENRVVKLKTKIHHEQNKEEMDSQEKFFQEQMQQFYDERNEKEEHLEKLQQLKREKFTEVDTNSSHLRRDEEIDKLIKLQDKELKEYEERREGLLKKHEGRMRELTRRHFDEKMAVEKEFDQELNKLMEEYTPTPGQISK